MFVSFEGVDGSGKTTLSSELARRIELAGYPLVVVEKRTARFSVPYVDQHMATLRSILWDYPREAPVSALGDAHWLHLQAAWFSTIAHCRVEPALARGAIVLVDNWYFKLWARFRAKGTESGRLAEACFAHLRRPDVVFFLDVSPEEALARKQQLLPSECGVFDGLSNDPQSDFLEYQRRVYLQMSTMCDGFGWHRLASGSTPAELAHACMDVLHHRKQQVTSTS